MNIEQRLDDLGIILPALPTPKGNYLPAVIHNGTLYLSGQGPIMDNGELATGVVGRDVSAELAYEHARRTGLVLLAAAKSVLGSLDRIERVINVYGMINAAADFIGHPGVINGCSDLMVEIFGERGRHVRAAVGMGSLPGNISVEITAIMAVKAT